MRNSSRYIVRARIHPRCNVFFFLLFSSPLTFKQSSNSQNHLDSVKELLKRNLTIFFIRCISLRNIIIIVTRKACNFKVINVLVFTVSFFYVITSESKFFYAHLIYIFLFLSCKISFKTLILSTQFSTNRYFNFHTQHGFCYIILYYNFIHFEDIKYSIESNI